MDVAMFGENLWLLALGFAMSAMGVPVPTLALYPLLITWSNTATGFSWVALVVAAGGTITGHLLALAIFRALGPPAVESIATAWPAAGQGVERVRTHLAHLLEGGTWWWIVPLRWLSTGYAQLFWLLGILPRLHWRLLLFLVLNDLAWALGWVYGFSWLNTIVPSMARVVNIAIPILLAVYLVMVVGGILNQRGQQRDRRAQKDQRGKRAQPDLVKPDRGESS